MAEEGTISKHPNLRPIRPGEVRNPTGRNGKVGLVALREFLNDRAEPSSAHSRRDNLMRAIYATAIDRRRRDHVAAARVLLAYEAGLPPQGVEYRFPDGTLMAKSEEQIWAEMERRAGEGTAAVEEESGEDKTE